MFKYQRNQTVDIHMDPQLKTGYIGRAKLIKPVRIGDPFILDVNPVSEKLNISYVIEYWIVIINGHYQMKGVRRVNEMGYTPSNVTEEKVFSNAQTSNNTDNFAILTDYDTSVWDERVSGTECRGQVF